MKAPACRTVDVVVAVRAPIVLGEGVPGSVAGCDRGLEGSEEARRTKKTTGGGWVLGKDTGREEEGRQGREGQRSQRLASRGDRTVEVE